MMRSKPHSSNHDTVSAETRAQRSVAQADAARENGQKGGRPPAWSQEVRRVAVDCLRRQAAHVASPLGEELLRLAQALEAGTLRLRGQSVTGAERVAAELSAPPPKRPTNMRIAVTLGVTGGRSAHGRNRALEEIVEQVLRPYGSKLDSDGLDYLVTVPWKSDEELDQILSSRIPTAARAIAARRHCGVEYSARSLDVPGRSWNPPPPAPPAVRKNIQLDLWFIVQGGRSPRHAKQVMKAIEEQLRIRYPLETVDTAACDYRVAVSHRTDEELDRIVKEIVQQAGATAHERQCTVEYEIQVTGNPRRSWPGVV